MNHKETTKKWYWKKYRETVALGYQCVAWAKKYCAERWYPIKWFWGSAIQWWITWSPFDNTWERIESTPFNYPSEGDIVFWANPPYGHVWVANNFCNPVVLRCSDQNGGWNEESIQPRWLSYKNVLWWYHKI